MNILFIVALLLAWPTYGMSIILWIIIFFLKPITAADKIKMRHKIAPELELLFDNRHSEFYDALDIPLKSEIDDSHQFVTYIINYIAQNPDELHTFINGMKRWTRRDGSLCHPSIVVRIEKRMGDRHGVYEVSIRAIDCLVRNNPSIQLFQSVDIDRIRISNSDILCI